MSTVMSRLSMVPPSRILGGLRPPARHKTSVRRGAARPGA
jgi:hypothetical protein